MSEKVIERRKDRSIPIAEIVSFLCYPTNDEWLDMTIVFKDGTEKHYAGFYDLEFKEGKILFDGYEYIDE